MDNSTNKDTIAGQDNILLVLNEFSEEYKTNSRQITELITAVNACSNKLQNLIEKENNLSSGTITVEAETLRTLMDDTAEQIKYSVKQISFPEQSLNTLSEKIAENTLLLKNPGTQKIIHHHHASRLLWVVAGLFLILLFCSTRWYLSVEKLDAYTAGDIKYRYMKQKGNTQLIQMLYYLDSLQLTAYHMKDSVVLWENQEQQAFELSQKLKVQSEQSQQLNGELKSLETQRNKRKGLK